MYVKRDTSDLFPSSHRQSGCNAYEVYTFTKDDYAFRASQSIRDEVTDQRGAAFEVKSRKAQHWKKQRGIRRNRGFIAMAIFSF